MNVNVIAGMQTTAESFASAKTQTKPAQDVQEKAAEDAVYEKKEETSAKTPYSINKMSKEERAALVQQLKDDQVNRQKSLTDLVSKMLGKQVDVFSMATGQAKVWEKFANGESIDEAAVKQAQEDISEDGYWGVKQTSQRLFDFASALAGDDEAMMKKMQDAMMDGFKQATKAWGKELPDISHQTIDAANKLFQDYYDSKTA